MGRLYWGQASSEMTAMVPTGSTSRMASTAPIPAAEAPTITYFAILASDLLEFEGLVGAVGDAGWFFLVLAEVAFGDYFVFFIHFYGAVWANHDAGPAADAFVFVVFDFACFFVFGHGAA